MFADLACWRVQRCVAVSDENFVSLLLFCTGISIGESGKLIGARWRALSEAEKEVSLFYFVDILVADFLDGGTSDTDLFAHFLNFVCNQSYKQKSQRIKEGRDDDEN